MSAQAVSSTQTEHNVQAVLVILEIFSSVKITIFAPLLSDKGIILITLFVYALILLTSNLLNICSFI